MEKLITKRDWQLFLALNRNFCGFGNPYGKYCVIQDGLTIDLKSEEAGNAIIRLMGQQSVWEYFILKQKDKMGHLPYCPKYAKEHIEECLEWTSPHTNVNNTFFLLLTDDFYFSNFEDWKHKITNNLLAYRPFIATFEKLYMFSSTIPEEELPELVPQEVYNRLIFTSL